MSFQTLWTIYYNAPPLCCIPDFFDYICPFWRYIPSTKSLKHNALDGWLECSSYLQSKDSENQFAMLYETLVLIIQSLENSEN